MNQLFSFCYPGDMFQPRRTHLDERFFQSSLASRICLLIVLVCGFFLRFLHLGTPSLWWNEILVPLSAQFSLSYIFDWTRLCEIHPPYLYMLTKFFMLFDDSEFALRLFPAVLGVASIYLSYAMFRGVLGEGGALLFAALIAINPLHIFLSRQLRPYAPFMFLMLIKIPLILSLLDQCSKKRHALLFVLNVLLFSLNYTNFLIVFSETVAMAIVLFSQSKKWLLPSFTYGSLSAVSSLPVLWPFLSRSAILREDLGVFSASFAHTISVCADNFAKVLYYFDNAIIVGTMACLSIAGFVCLWRRQKHTALALILFAVLPVLILIAGKYGYDFRPWNAVFLMPTLLFSIAYAGSVLVHSRNVLLVFSAILSIVGMIHLTQVYWDAFYGETSGIEKSYLRSIARKAASFNNSGEPMVALDSGLSSSTSWYLEKWFSVDPLSTLHLVPARESTQVAIIGYRDDAPPEAATLVERTRAGGIDFVRLSIPRRSLGIAALPAVIALSPDPYSALSLAEEIRDLTPKFGRGYQIIPTRHSREGELRYDIHNFSGSGPQQFFLDVKFHQLGRGNIFTLQGRFDEEPWQNMLVKDVPTDQNREFVKLKRFAQYRNFSLRVLMRAEPITPSYPGNNLEMVAFEGLELKIEALHGDLFKQSGLDASMEVYGINTVEEDETYKWRWAVGGTSSIVFEAPQGRREIPLSFAVNNPIPGQTMSIYVNGVHVKQFDDIPAHGWMRERLAEDMAIPVVDGKNTIEFRFLKQNGNGFVFNETDSTPYSAAFTRLELGY